MHVIDFQYDLRWRTCKVQVLTSVGILSMLMIHASGNDSIDLRFQWNLINIVNRKWNSIGIKTDGNVNTMKPHPTVIFQYRGHLRIFDHASSTTFGLLWSRNELVGIERIQGYLKSRRFLQRYSDGSLTRLKMWDQIAWIITKRESSRNKYNRITKIKGITRPLITVLRVSSWKFTIHLKENNLSSRNCRACVSNSGQDTFR